MNSSSNSASRPASIMIFGVGAFAYSTAQILKDDGAEVSTYLTRSYGHFAPSLAGPTWNHEQHPNPCALLKSHQVDLIIPMSINWAQAPWKDELLAGRTPIFCPIGEGMRIERERDFARQLCQQFHIPFPQAHVAANRLEAEEILRRGIRALRHQEPALLADQPHAHDSVRDHRGHARLAPTSRIMPKAFSCRNTWAGRRRATSRWSAAAKFIRWSPTRNTSAPSPATWASWPARRWADWWSAIETTNTGWRANCCTRCGRGSAK